MAATNLTVNQILDRDEFMTAVTTSALFQAVNAADGAEMVWNARDDKYIVIIQNADSDAKSVTVKAGDGLQSAFGDLTVNLAAGKTTAVCLNSGRFKITSGADKGKVKFTGGSANVKIAVFRMP